jgi:hypothetical protein
MSKSTSRPTPPPPHRKRHIHPNPYQQYILYKLSVRLGDSLKLILLLDGVRVGRSLGGVDELIGEALGDGH